MPESERSVRVPFWNIGSIPCALALSKRIESHEWSRTSSFGKGLQHSSMLISTFLFVSALLVKFSIYYPFSCQESSLDTDVSVYQTRLLFDAAQLSLVDKMLAITKSTTSSRVLIISNVHSAPGSLSYSFLLSLFGPITWWRVQTSQDHWVSLGGETAIIRSSHMSSSQKHCTNNAFVRWPQFVTTLDLIQKLCTLRKYSCLRLDGTMGSSKRQVVVDKVWVWEFWEFCYAVFL